VKLIKWALIGLLALVGTYTSASTIAFSLQIDASSSTAYPIAPPYFLRVFTIPIDPVRQFAAGDSVEISVSFLPGQRLQLVHPTTVGAEATGTSPGASVFAERTAELLGLSGPARSTHPTTLGTGPIGGDWDLFDLDDPSDTTATISFSGFRATTDVREIFDSATNLPIGSQPLESISFYFQALDYRVINEDLVRSAPAPGVVSLLLLGLLPFGARFARSHEPTSS